MTFSVLDLARESGGEYRKVTANEYQGPCPGCGGADRFCIFPEQNDKGDGRGPRGSYHCGHGKGGNGCGKAGDNIQFLRDFRGMNYKEACVYLGLETSSGNGPGKAEAYKPPSIPKTAESRQKFTAAASGHTADVEDVEKWREHGEKFVNRCHDALLQREKSMQYLAGRGVSLAMVQKYRLGLHLGKPSGSGEEWQPDFRPCVSWGMRGGVNPKTQKQQTFVLPAGLVIPWFVAGGLQRIRIRMAKPDAKDPKKKYHVVKGSALSTWISRTDARVYLVEETELDAIMLEEQAGDLIGVIGLGACGIRPDAEATKSLIKAIWVLNALDYDKAGAKARHWWQEEFPSTCRRWPVPVGKDPGEAYQQGVDIRAWIKAGLPPVMLAGGNQESVDQREKRLAAQLAVAPTGEVAEMLQLLTESGGVLRLTGHGEALTVKTSDEWAGQNREKAQRLSELVFTSEDVGRYVGRLPDGVYTAANIELSVREGIDMMELPTKGRQVSVTQLKHLCVHHKKVDIYERLISEPVPPKQFVSDGCSAWPDWVGGDIYPACFWHDVRYWLGGDEAYREFADRQLRNDVFTITSNERLAEMMHHGVRIGGAPGSGMPWQWGYGWV